MSVSEASCAAKSDPPELTQAAGILNDMNCQDLHISYSDSRVTPTLTDTNP
ncbi:hypothetical protein ACFC25_01805 [Pseudarthrobacter sp. NPDC055928]|uniref:hypothetical protein n=1 Tax=Pseudarthrobacter sp. NPDC055928 TaxID=3345661 RepID=UPI0035E2B5EF